MLNELNKEPQDSKDGKVNVYKQLPQWLQEAKVFWDIIDKHTKELTKFDNMDEIKANKAVSAKLK